MGVLRQLWDMFVSAVNVNERVHSLSSTVADQRVRIDNLTERVARLEASLDLLMRLGGSKRLE